MRLSILLLLTACKGPGADEVSSRRLTPTEYNHAVRDLLAVDPGDEGAIVLESGDDPDDEDFDADWPWVFPGDIEIGGFEGMAEGQVASSYLVEQHQQAAGHFAEIIVASDAFWACAPSELDDADLAACTKASIRRFAARAWRRPLTEAEDARLMAFLEDSVRAWGFTSGAQLVVQGVLLSPQFVYRLEATPHEDDRKAERREHAAFQRASRLSFLLWDSMPDPILFEAAAIGRLDDPDDIDAQVGRMLADPRTRQAVVHFHEQWLDIDAVYSSNADMDAYLDRYLPDLEEVYDEDEPLFHEEMEEQWSYFLISLRAGMVMEARKFVEYTVFDGGGRLRDLLTDTRGYVTEATHEEGLDIGTADLYGVSPDDLIDGDSETVELFDGNFAFRLRVRAAELPADQRAGVLTLGATLAGQAHPVHPAPILRGVHLLERMGCQTIGQPPDGAAGSAPADSLDAESTNRERVETVTQSPECIGCHQQINPPGFAFENFDSLGGWRDTDNGLPVDASGTLILDGQELGSFEGAPELAALLAQSRTVHDCYARTWAEYAVGTELDPTDPTLVDIQDRFWAAEGDILALLADIATSDLVAN